MATGPLNHVLTHLRRAALLYEFRDLTDGQLLERFLARREEQAFTALVRRHGPMVLGVCQRVLGNEHDAEDAFQSTFLVLARKAASVVPSDRVGHWLYGVAYRTALKAKTTAARRWRVERQACQAGGLQHRAENAPDDLRSLLDEELRRLPGKYGAPLVLCLLEGKTRKEAARILGWTEGTLSGRLARAKTLLAARLARRGLPLGGATLAMPVAAAGARASVPVPLAAATVKAALSVGAGQQVLGTVSAQVIALTEEVLKAMLLTKLKVVTAIALAVSIGIGGGMVACHPRATAQGESGQLCEGIAPGGSLLSQQLRANPPPYVIEPPDLLTVTYFGKDQAVKKMIEGEHLVRVDGTISLGAYGSVSVTGLTLDQARWAIASKCRDAAPDVDGQEVKVEVLASNSKFYELITEDERGREQVYRLPLTGNDTVLHALSRSDDLWRQTFNKRVWIIRRPQEKGDTEKTLFVDWAAITQRGSTATNYLLFPRHRIYVKAAAPLMADDVSGSPQRDEHNAGQADKETTEIANASEKAKKVLSRLVYLDIEYPTAIAHKSAIGVVVDRRGYVLSTSAPLQGAKRIRARFADGSILDSNSWVSDESGLARINLEKPLSRNQPVVKFADPESVRRGETIWVAGMGDGNTGTLVLRPGVVAALNGEVMMEPKRHIKGLIQVDQQVDAGSPLMNQEGELVGLCLSASEKGVSVGLAIPSERVEEACNNLKR